MSLEDIKKEFFKKCDDTNLYLLLMSRTKKDLDELRRTLEIAGASQLNKGDMAGAIELNMPELFEEELINIDLNTLNILKKVVSFNRIIPENEIGLLKGINLFYIGFLFPIETKNGRFYIMADEIYEIFRTYRMTDLADIARENSEIIDLIHGLLNLYGVVGFSTLYEMICEYINREIEYYEFDRLFRFANNMYDTIDGSGIFGFSQLCDKPYKLFFEKENSDISRKYFTKEQVMAYANSDYYAKTIETKRLERALLKHFKISKDSTGAIVGYVVYLLQKDADIKDILDSIYDEVGNFPDAFITELGDILMELNNNTLKWVLKGHTPVEVANMYNESASLNALFDSEITKKNKSNNKKPNLYVVKTGRNDPCPCGSGKKHKDCCGKN